MKAILESRIVDEFRWYGSPTDNYILGLQMFYCVPRADGKIDLHEFVGPYRYVASRTAQGIALRLPVRRRRVEFDASARGLQRKMRGHIIAGIWLGDWRHDCAQDMQRQISLLPWDSNWVPELPVGVPAMTHADDIIYVEDHRVVTRQIILPTPEILDRHWPRLVAAYDRLWNWLNDRVFLA